jgi:transcriptional regulator with XRE-family HTH domain
MQLLTLVPYPTNVKNMQFSSMMQQIMREATSMGGSAKRQVGRRIRRLRKAQHQSQQALATAIGVHVNTVARWEWDGIDPHHRALPLIAAALYCSLEKLTGGPTKSIDPLIICTPADSDHALRLSELVALYRDAFAYGAARE